MRVTEHDLSVWRGYTPFHDQLLDILGDTCREMHHETTEQSIFVLANEKAVMVNTDQGMVHITGAYTAHDDIIKRDFLILVGMDPGAGSDAVLFTPYCDKEYTYADDYLVIDGLEVYTIKPTGIGTYTPLAQPE